MLSFSLPSPIHVLAITFCWISCSHAESWVLPTRYDSKTYYGEFGWSSETSTSVFCTNGAGCRVSLCHYSSDPMDRCNPQAGSTPTVDLPPGATVHDAWRSFTSKYGVSGEWSDYVGGTLSPGACFGFLVHDLPLSLSDAGVLLPNSICGRVPPPAVECRTTSSMTLDHGSVSRDVADGSVTDSTLDIACNLAASVQVQLLGSRVVQLGAGLSSELSIDGQNLQSPVTVDIPAGGRVVLVKSRIVAAKGVAAGDYSGVGVLGLSYN